MRVVAVVQNKGGVGKTTVTRLLAEYFARKPLRVLGLDLDPQCNFSRRFSKSSGLSAQLIDDLLHIGFTAVCFCSQKIDIDITKTLAFV